MMGGGWADAARDVAVQAAGSLIVLAALTILVAVWRRERGRERPVVRHARGHLGVVDIVPLGCERRRRRGGDVRPG